jgi:hypothetical protein
MQLLNGATKYGAWRGVNNGLNNSHGMATAWRNEREANAESIVGRKKTLGGREINIGDNAISKTQSARRKWRKQCSARAQERQ